ncbi:MAG: RNA polymerase factor sigma-54 [Xanthomonadaceae bacterium]|nr:RNA polymerase factor sigma-54 [Xanthomonadaceae bacterium]
MKPALQLRINQQLALTPQLQQAIRLLQLSSVELEMELREALESNPLLELAESDSGDDEAEAQTDGEAVSDIARDGEAATTGSEEPGYDEPMDFELERSNFAAPAPEDADGFEAQDSEPEDLRDHLLWQLNLTSLSARDRAIGVTIIEAVDDDGYLHESNETLQSNLAGLYRVDADEIDAVRHRIQQFDPLGVGSRSLSECLRVQLDACSAETPGRSVALALAAEHLEALARNDRARLCRQLHADAEALDAAIALIRSLDPKPGAQVGGGKTEYVAPDAYAFKHNGRWSVGLSPNCQPKLAINQQYAALIARARRDDASYLRGQLQEARWLIKSLETRADTVLKVAGAIVRAQSAFLDFGPEAMRPLVLREIAEEIGMHESTVSRVTTRKYLHTPRGTFEFKYFFSSGVATVDGGAASATAIQAMIRKLIGEETPARPLSDQTLAAELNRRGIEVARRTVAKYREALHIPSSNERSRLG